MSLDPAKLSNVRVSSEGYGAACPACQEAGSDSSGTHLRVFRDGSYGCAMDRTPEHYSRIFALAGAGTTGETTYTPPPLPPIEVERIWPADVLDRLVKDHSYWEGRGISAATVAPFRGGVATSGQMAGRYTFPLFNEDDAIIGFDGRRIDGRPDKPWKIIGKSSRFVWGNPDEIASSGRAILVESIGDALMLMEHGMTDVLCLFGTSISQAVLGKLIELSPHDIVVATNRDNPREIGIGEAKRIITPGQDAATRIAATLSRFWDEGVVRICLPPAPFEDFGQMDQIALDTYRNSLSIDSTPSP